MMNFISYCDGSLDLLHISEAIGENFESILPIVEVLLENSIIEELAYE